MALSPIDIELVRTALGSVVDEMYVALMKSAHSTNIKERCDHSTALFDRRGRVVAQGESLPLHLASMLGLVEVVLERHGRDGLGPGDMFISNDPFVGRGSHLPDVAMVMPVFHDGRLVLFVANIAHHADIGGMVPGSVAGGMTEIFQEGVRIPAIRIVKDGAVVEDVLDLICLNVRVPRERRGDYLAQIAVNRLGARRLAELFARTPVAHVEEAADALIEAVARRMRAGIAALPDGTYRFEDRVDDDGMGTRNIPVCVTITVDGEAITLDFAGSGPQCRGNINTSFAGLQASVLYALKVLVDPDGPTNHGMVDPVTIHAPERSIVNAGFPAATAARAQTCQRVIDVILGALAPAVGDRAVAASNGANTTTTFSGVGPDGTYYVYMETIGGGAGARATRDGVDGVQVHITNTSNLPIEALEREYPILIECYALEPDTGGAGTWRGGLALRRDYRALGHVTTFSAQGERFDSAPWGLSGGGPGGRGRHHLRFDDGRVEDLPAKPIPRDVPPDAVVSVVTPGAGGFGPPEGRAPEDRAADLADGKVSPAFLSRWYPDPQP
ncbi:hydantoinase B/oxoprolinase family protein [Roseospira navarrensis]|uniref:hydantoinase B/oxoprolinase family protein n=1 Tax=Roseospira navarrensis TaxID=140058 RepID=UPI001B87B3EE